MESKKLKVGNYEVDSNILSIDGCDGEEFKPYRGRYFVSNKARIYDCKRNRFLPDKINESSGYKFWFLCDYDPGSKKIWGRDMEYIHNVMAKVWLEKPSSDEILVVDHKDGDKFNNSLENLRYFTAKQNAIAQDVQIRKRREQMKTLKHKKEIKERDLEIESLKKKLSEKDNYITRLERCLGELLMSNCDE